MVPPDLWILTEYMVQGSMYNVTSITHTKLNCFLIPKKIPLNHSLSGASWTPSYVELGRDSVNVARYSQRRVVFARQRTADHSSRLEITQRVDQW